MTQLISMHRDENFEFQFSSQPYSPTVPPHFHNCYEILYFEKGDAVYLVEGNTYNLSEGDILITNPREMHCPVFKSNKEYQRSIIFLKQPYLSDFITEKYNPFSALENRRIGTQNRIDTDVVKEYKLDERFKAIKGVADDMPEGELVIKTNLLQLLISINNIVSADVNTAKANKINEIIQFINQNLTSKITLDLLAEKFYLNKYYISHMFAEKTGINISSYITNKRILHAKELLLEGKPAVEVFQEVGFSDYSSFYRAFKNTLGASPSSIAKM